MDNTFLTFKVGKLNFAIDIANVKEIISVGEITKLPKSTSNIAGLTNYRGEIIGVIDLAILLNEMESHSLKRIIVIETGENKIGLLINSASNFLKIPNNSQLKSLQITDNNLEQLAKGIYETKEGIFYIIDVDKLVKIVAG